MAIVVCSEISSAGISPRISFSQDLSQSDTASPNQTRLDSSLLESDSGFDFCIGNFFAQELSSADELFSNGRLLPVPVKNSKNIRSTDVLHPSANHQPARTSSSEKKSLKEFLSAIDSDEKPPRESKSFWQFKRSSSLNGEISRNRSLIRSLHFLSRSNSTGSAPNPKETQNQKPSLQKQQSIPKTKSSSSSYCYTYSSSQKPSTGKSFGSHGNGVRISPVLNLPPPYITKVTVSTGRSSVCERRRWSRRQIGTMIIQFSIFMAILLSCFLFSIILG